MLTEGLNARPNLSYLAIKLAFEEDLSIPKIDWEVTIILGVRTNSIPKISLRSKNKR